MTVDEFLKLPSRERDAIVAPVMGWMHVKLGRIADRVIVGARHASWPHDERTIVPEYTTDPARALEVLAKMLYDGYAYGHWATPPHSSVMPGVCVALRRGVYPPDWRNPNDAYAIAETFPLAASAAALLALGVLEP